LILILKTKNSLHLWRLMLVWLHPSTLWFKKSFHTHIVDGGAIFILFKQIYILWINSKPILHALRLTTPIPLRHPPTIPNLLFKKTLVYLKCFHKLTSLVPPTKKERGQKKKKKKTLDGIKNWKLNKTCLVGVLGSGFGPNSSWWPILE
jgi:hypothetical protein